MVTCADVWIIVTLLCISCVLDVNGSVWKDKYYSRCKKSAISKDKVQEPPKSLLTMGHRLLKEKFEGNQRSYAEIRSEFIKSDIAIEINNKSCPSGTEISRSGGMKTCPTYTILERDDNRIPSLLSQVKCRCLHCLGPWHNGESRRCTPLFDFKYVFRVIGKRHGHKQYALVREPQSYACACLKKVKRTTFVMPP